MTSLKVPDSAPIMNEMQGAFMNDPEDISNYTSHHESSKYSSYSELSNHSSYSEPSQSSSQVMVVKSFHSAASVAALEQLHHASVSDDAKNSAVSDQVQHKSNVSRNSVKTDGGDRKIGKYSVDADRTHCASAVQRDRKLRKKSPREDNEKPDIHYISIPSEMTQQPGDQPGPSQMVIATVLVLDPSVKKRRSIMIEINPEQNQANPLPIREVPMDPPVIAEEFEPGVEHVCSSDVQVGTISSTSSDITNHKVSSQEEMTANPQVPPNFNNIGNNILESPSQVLFQAKETDNSANFISTENLRISDEWPLDSGATEQYSTPRQSFDSPVNPYQLSAGINNEINSRTEAETSSDDGHHHNLNSASCSKIVKAPSKEGTTANSQVVSARNLSVCVVEELHDSAIINLSASPTNQPSSSKQDHANLSIGVNNHTSEIDNSSHNIASHKSLHTPRGMSSHQNSEAASEITNSQMDANVICTRNSSENLGKDERSTSVISYSEIQSSLSMNSQMSSPTEDTTNTRLVAKSVIRRNLEDERPLDSSATHASQLVNSQHPSTVRVSDDSIIEIDNIVHKELMIESVTASTENLQYYLNTTPHSSSSEMSSVEMTKTNTPIAASVISTKNPSECADEGPFDSHTLNHSPSHVSQISSSQYNHASSQTKVSDHAGELGSSHQIKTTEPKKESQNDDNLPRIRNTVSSISLHSSTHLESEAGLDSSSMPDLKYYSITAFSSSSHSSKPSLGSSSHQKFTAESNHDFQHNDLNTASSGSSHYSKSTFNHHKSEAAPDNCLQHDNINTVSSSSPKNTFSHHHHSETGSKNNPQLDNDNYQYSTKLSLV